MRDGGGREELGLVVVVDGQLVFGQVSERGLGEDCGVVQAAEVCGCRHLLVAGVAGAVGEGVVGGVGVHAEVVEVREVEAVVLEEGAVSADRCDLFRFDGDDGVVDCGAAAVHAAHESK